LATVPVSPSASEAGRLGLARVPRGGGRRSTSHLKLVPPTRELRDDLRQRCHEAVARLDKSTPLTKDGLEAIARRTLEERQLPEGYVGWTMVALASAFWRDQVAAVPPARRLFLLPHCLKHAEGCPADYDEFGLDCERCGACSIADFRTTAEKMGYKVLVAEGSPIVLKIIVSGHVDAILGVACLNVLEKAIDKILLAGIPCVAVPLLSSDCRNTSVDEDLVREMIELESARPAQQTRTYLHLMRAASQMFQPENLESLAPRVRGGPRLADVHGEEAAALDALAATEALAHDFLVRGGKYSRPFITLAVYDALAEIGGTLPDGARRLDQLPLAVKRTALSIETFHKASLVHDDIEDDDAYRYGRETLHRKYGVATAINVGDYLIGLGYRLVSREGPQLGAETVCGILDSLADAHLKLSEGQGAELAWRESPRKQLEPLDALKIYALKTAPAFEAALLAGARLAGRTEAYAEAFKLFARHLGVAFQILNDLHDWLGDEANKLAAGSDLLRGRPTLLWALALEGLDEAGRRELLALIRADDHPPAQRLALARQLYQRAGAFEKAHRLVDKYQDRAQAVADDIRPEALQRLMYYLVDVVLERPAATEPQLFQAIVPAAP